MTGDNEETEYENSRTADQSKVVMLLDQYDLPTLGDELVERWTGNRSERMSLRELADYVNKTLLATALDDAGGSSIDGEVENFYRLLTSDDVSSGTRIEAENKLEQWGIDVDQLTADFVSRQAVHTYLTKERDVRYNREEKTAAERIDDRLETIQRTKHRLRTIVERTFAELARADLLTSGSTHVTVLVRVECSDCNNQYRINEFLTAGGCGCDSDDPQA